MTAPLMTAALRHASASLKAWVGMQLPLAMAAGLRVARSVS